MLHSGKSYKVVSGMCLRIISLKAVQIFPSFHVILHHNLSVALIYGKFLLSKNCYYIAFEIFRAGHVIKI